MPQPTSPDARPSPPQLPAQLWYQLRNEAGPELLKASRELASAALAATTDTSGNGRWAVAHAVSTRTSRQGDRTRPNVLDRVAKSINDWQLASGVSDRDTAEVVNKLMSAAYNPNSRRALETLLPRDLVPPSVNAGLTF